MREPPWLPVNQLIALASGTAAPRSFSTPVSQSGSISGTGESSKFVQSGCGGLRTLFNHPSREPDHNIIRNRPDGGDVAGDEEAVSRHDPPCSGANANSFLRKAADSSCLARTGNQLPSFRVSAQAAADFSRNTRSSQSGSISGTDLSSFSVYAGCGGERTSSLMPCSTTRPSSMTTISSEIASTVAMS